MASVASGSVPKEVRQELDEIAGAIEKTPFFGLSDDESVAKYWRSLDRLGQLLTPELHVQVAPELNALATEILAIAASLGQKKAQVEELSLWYGRFQFNSKQVHQVERLHDEHAIEAYRHAWEAWFLAPSTKEKVRLLPRAHQAISRIANPLSVPLLVEAFKDAARDRDMRDDPRKRDSQAWAIIYTIHSFKSEAALVALLECREEALKAGVGPGSAIYFAQDKSFDESFVRLMTSTRHDPEAPPFNEGWKAYLPHVETQLARGDLPAAHRLILNHIATPLRARQGR